jgi:hypothetical protein
MRDFKGGADSFHSAPLTAILRQNTSIPFPYHMAGKGLNVERLWGMLPNAWRKIRIEDGLPEITTCAMIIPGAEALSPGFNAVSLKNGVSETVKPNRFKPDK